MSERDAILTGEDGLLNGNDGWIHVARKDLADAGRSKLFAGVVGVLILIGIALSVVPYLAGETGQDGAEFAAAAIQTPVSIALPVLGAMIGYMAIINERDSGSIRVLLGLPLRRADVVVGKFLGRSVVLVAALIAAGLVGALLSLLLYGTVEGDTLLAFGLVGSILSVVYVAVAIGVSASVNSRGKALGLLAAILILFVYAWRFVVLGVIRVVEGTWTPTEVPNYAVFLLSLDPSVAATRVANYLMSDVIEDPFGDLGFLIGEVPWYLDQWVAIPILIAWIVVPLGIGYYAFVNADL